MEESDACVPCTTLLPETEKRIKMSTSMTSFSNIDGKFPTLTIAFMVINYTGEEDDPSTELLCAHALEGRTYRNRQTGKELDSVICFRFCCL